MITVTANAFHEKLNVGDEDIVMNGPPAHLRGQIFLKNTNEEALFIRDLPLSHPEEGKRLPQMPASLKFTASIGGGEERVHRIRHQLPRNTPPGEYESIIHVGGEQKKLKMIVQPNIDILVHPLSIHFTGVIPGESYYAQLSFTNYGNVPFKIPDVKHVNTFDENFICRAASFAMREKGGEGFNAMMDELTKNIHKEMAGWANIKFEESGRTLEPGESIQLHVTLTLPKNVDASKDYFGSVRLWNKTLSYNIKSH